MASSAGWVAWAAATGGNGGNGGNGGPDLPGLPELPLGGLDGLLNRPAVGGTDGGVTMGQLSAAYDPALVSLLTPGMVLR